MTNRLLVLPGDGIGPEVTDQVMRVIDWLRRRRSVDLEAVPGLVGGAAFEATGSPVPEETISNALECDAVLLGAVGGPQWDSLDFDLRPERGLLGLRKAMAVYANLRPARVFDALAEASTLKSELVTGLDIMIVRELTGGIYFGEPRGVETLAEGGRRGVNTEVYTSDEIRRVARVGFDLARTRHSLVHSIDKANVLESGQLWRQEVQALRDAEYGDVELKHMYVDNAAMQLVREPKQFDVIVTTNMFGDILSDFGAMLTGSLGMLPSASLGDAKDESARPGLYEPVHGSAPDIAGRDIANPIAQISSFAMLLRYSLDMSDEADLIENAVQSVLAGGLRTADIMQPGKAKVSTTVMGDAIIRGLDSLAA